MEQENVKKELIENEIEELELTDDIHVDQQEQKINPRKVKRQKRNRTIFLIWNFMSVLAFTGISLLFILKTWLNSVFAYVIIGITVLYFIIFLVLIIRSAKNQKLMKTSIKTYRVQMKLWRCILGILNLVLTISLLASAYNIDDKNFAGVVVIVLGTIYAVIRILIFLIQMALLVRKQKKINRKRQQIINKKS